jgi:ABC-type polysaccharide/polyol phosphate transport system ATPase subunit
VSEPTIVLDDVHKAFKIYHKRHSTLKEALLRRRRAEFERVPVLDGVSLEVEAGQSLGIIGRNGAGKSTTLKVIAGLMPPDAGEVTVRGRVSTLLELGAGFQGEYSGAENVYLYAALMGLSRRFVDERFAQIVEFSGIGQHIDNAVKTYSSGMYARLAFAVAVHVDPDILIVDEVLAVGDEAFQRRCFERAQDLRNRGKTIVLVSHDLGAVQRFCDRVVWIDGGRIRADGDPQTVCRLYIESVEHAAETAARATGAPVAVKLLGVTDRVGRPTGALRTGDGTRVTFVIESERRVPDARVSIRWTTANGTLAMVTDSGAVDLPEGDLRFLCSADAIPLVAGAYTVDVGVFHGPDRLSLPHSPIVVHLLGAHEEGVVSVPWVWEAGAEDPAVRVPGVADGSAS